ncbi:MAG: hypothetical protein JSV78_12990 [Phycisphaerales bacterium]|nr:MAG: hypothetical protein JSV78_12990 [Phycisphaerales bacterium]
MKVQQNRDTMDPHLKAAVARTIRAPRPGKEGHRPADEFSTQVVSSLEGGDK